jgi:hypothetical protein
MVWQILRGFLVTFGFLRSQIAQVGDDMSTPRQVSARTATNSQEQREFFGSTSEPGFAPVERMRSVSVLHWPEYAMEGALLGLFMISACVITVIFQLPHSQIRQAIASAELRRMLNGVAMGLTAMALIYSPWGQRSGAHLNPSVTLTFLRLGKITRRDAALYLAFQFAGAALGVLVAAMILGSSIGDESVRYAATYPGPSGIALAAIAEFAISFL